MKHKTTKLWSVLLSLMLMMSLIPAFNMTALADGDTNTTSYTLTIPSALTVANSGWNATDGISATGTLESGKKLTVTATSVNNWALKTDDNSVGYKIATASTDTTATTSWEFTELSNTATTKAMGIIVEDYSTKPAGTYQDTVTFTASVVSATKKLTLTGRYIDWDAEEDVTKTLTIEYTDNDTWKDIAGRYGEVSLVDNIYGPSDGKIVMYWGEDGCELKSKQSTYNYELVSINDKVSAYSSYYLGH